MKELNSFLTETVTGAILVGLPFNIMFLRDTTNVGLGILMGLANLNILLAIANKIIEFFKKH